MRDNRQSPSNFADPMRFLNATQKKQRRSRSCSFAQMSIVVALVVGQLALISNAFTTQNSRALTKQPKGMLNQESLQEYWLINPRCREYSMIFAVKESKQDSGVLQLLEKDNAAEESKDNSTVTVSEAEDLLLGFPRDTVARPLLLLLLSQFLLFIGVGAVIPSVPLYGKEIGLSSAVSGVVISAPAVAMLLGAKFGGNFADKARKPAMIIGMAVIAASDLGTALANGLVTLVIARFGLGAGRCLSEAGERGMLADLAGKAPEMRGRALAAQQAVIALGVAIGAPLGGLVVEEYGVRATFLCVTAAAITALVLYLFLPETVIGENTRNSQEENDKTAEMEAVLLAPGEAVDDRRLLEEENRSAEGEWTKLLSKRQWRGLAAAQCGVSIGFAAKVAAVPLLAREILPGGAAGAGALLSAAGLSGLLGAPMGGWLTDRTGAKSTAVLSGVVSATALAMVPFALQLDNFEVPVPFLGDESIAAVAFSAAVILWSLGVSAQGPALTALAQQLAPAGAEATAMALPRATGDGVYIVAPFILGLVTDSAASVPGAECAFAGMGILIGAIALALSGDGDDL